MTFLHSVYRNGNYFVILKGRCSLEKRCFRIDEPLTPDFPDSIDLKISNRCSIGCPYCHEESIPAWGLADFDEIKGQDAIVTTLRNQIESGRIGHAYLFCGTRGTGKTSAAKVFAKAVNCENPVGGNPCGKCESCKSIADGTSLNVIEMDAASNNGVDDARLVANVIEPNKKWEIDNPSWCTGRIAPYTFTMEKLD